MSSTWEVRFSNSKQLPYFHDPSTGASSWEPPSELSDSQIRSLPGAAQYLGGAASATNGSSAAGHAGQVRASHLLVKHRESRRPSSWKESNIIRSPAEAEEILKGHLTSLGANPTPEKFAELAKVHSDCSSARSGGDLGFFGKGQMQKAFEDNTYALQVGQLSDIVSTDSGKHLILRTA
ncbi:rotamase-domain-containing protein [Ceraceosorus bombacis]|uniref:Peptidyl-prolyl cis-trans isomerase n=1 Tax=Ceraceosorus bombacis TaxID=401625 RepID=A0A0P1BGE1_9BASI|nr:rotamase-domain-containing protein [Ceraceosorus bombacis]